MRIKEIKIYTFEELSKEAQKKAINDFRSNNDYHIESQFITENMEETVIEKTCKTIQDLKISWSLNYCQCDGVSFTGEIYGYNENFIKFLENIYNGEVPKNIKRIANAIIIKFKRINTFSTHEITVDTEIELTGKYLGNIDRIEKLIEDLEKSIEVWRIDLCYALETQGYAELDHYNSDEYITEELSNNCYEFLEEGTICCL